MAPEELESLQTQVDMYSTRLLNYPTLYLEGMLHVANSMTEATTRLIEDDVFDNLDQQNGAVLATTGFALLAVSLSSILEEREDRS